MHFHFEPPNTNENKNPQKLNTMKMKIQMQLLIQKNTNTNANAKMSNTATYWAHVFLLKVIQGQICAKVLHVISLNSNCAKHFCDDILLVEFINI